jgi:hypothetical protein
VSEDSDNLDRLKAALAMLDEVFNGNKPPGLDADEHSWRKYGLMILQFRYGITDDLTNYVSNGADRPGAVKLLRETADAMEAETRRMDTDTANMINEADIGETVRDQVERDGEIKIDAIGKRLADNGKLVEAGWHGLRRAALPPTASKHRLDEMRTAFFAGALHVFSTLIQVVDEDDEPTQNDYRRMELMAKELRAFAKQRFGV